MMIELPGVDECRDRLHRAGWSIGETAIGPDQAMVWLITGTNGENRIEARGRSQTEAVGMLARPKVGEER